jgi:formiminotetrahydrofolate cyclodeaminase
LGAATSAGLVGMVAQYTTGEKWADRAERMRVVIDEAAALRLRAVALAEEDALAFSAVSAAYKLPKETSDEKAARSAAIQAALINAARPPALTGELAVRLVELAEELAESGNPNVVSDVAVASSVARSALESAIVNIEINLAQIRSDAESERLTQLVKEFEAAMVTADRVTALVREKVRA